MSDRINKIIAETEQLLKTINRFQKEAIYVENSEKNKLEVKTGDSLLKKEVAREVEKKAVTEVDLFGNITIKKEDWEFSESLDEMDKMICECQKCRLGAGRNKFVFGVGDPNSDIVFIGEAPGADEDAQGEPFVGRAGQLLNKIIESIGFKREEVYICNIIKCRPPGNRNPLPDEVEQCRPYLEHQLNLIKPKLIMLLGRVAAESLLKTKEPLNKLRGKIHNYKGYKVMITFHPAALLRNPHWKRPTWDDIKQFKKLYDELIVDKK